MSTPVIVPELRGLRVGELGGKAVEHVAVAVGFCGADESERRVVKKGRKKKVVKGIKGS